MKATPIWKKKSLYKDLIMQKAIKVNLGKIVIFLTKGSLTKLFYVALTVTMQVFDDLRGWNSSTSFSNSLLSAISRSLLMR